MLDKALTYVSTVLSGIIGWMDKLFDAIPGSVELIISIFAIYTALRLLLVPLFGGLVSAGISDRVKKIRGKSNGSSNNSSKQGGKHG